MRRIGTSALAIAALALAPHIGRAQVMTETSNKVAGGGITAPGWTGKIDPKEEKAGLALKDSKLSRDGATYSVTTGPATTYWNPDKKATGNYTVSATFTEPKYMNKNDHPHPYGLMIGGNDLGTDQQSYLYCAAYGDGTFILRGYNGLTPFSLNGGRPVANPAVHKAAGAGQPVTQDIAMSVKGDKVECAINGTTVVSLDKATVVTAGKLKSTDGIYGFRFAHNTEGTVSKFAIEQK